MRLNIKDIETIIDHDWLSWSRKSQLIELYFNKKLEPIKYKILKIEL